MDDDKTGADDQRPDEQLAQELIERASRSGVWTWSARTSCWPA